MTNIHPLALALTLLLCLIPAVQAADAKPTMPTSDPAGQGFSGTISGTIQAGGNATWLVLQVTSAQAKADGAAVEALVGKQVVIRPEWDKQIGKFNQDQMKKFAKLKNNAPSEATAVVEPNAKDGSLTVVSFK